MEQIESLQPNSALQEKIEMWRHKRASFTAIAVGMYILGVAILCALPGFAALKIDWQNSSEAMEGGVSVAGYGLMGFIIFLCIVAVATGLLVYINMSMPADVATYLGKKPVGTSRISGDSTGSRLARAWLGCHTPVCVLVYFLVSFSTHAWHITWLIFLIDAALVNAVRNFFGEQNDGEED